MFCHSLNRLLTLPNLASHLTINVLLQTPTTREITNKSFNYQQLKLLNTHCMYL